MGIWLNPGGHIESGELPHEAAEREFYEETGVFVEAYWTNFEGLDGSTTEKGAKKKSKNDGNLKKNNATESNLGESDLKEINNSTEMRDFFTPNPISTNLHWISEKNYLTRLEAAKNDKNEYQKEAKWQKGCEQHLNFLYLVRPLGTIAIKQNKKETDGIEWFSLQELEKIETKEQIRREVALAFRVVESL